MAQAHTREQFDETWQAWQAATGPRKDRLLSKLVADNTPLARKFVKRILKYTKAHVEEDDAMQAGLIGLLIAIRKYDPKRPTRFSTMAWPWVRHEVTSMLQRTMQVYRPRGAGMPYKEFRESEAIQARTGRDATAAELGVSDKLLEKWRSVVFHFSPLNESKESNGKSKSEDNVSTYRGQDLLQDTGPLADEQIEQAELAAAIDEASKKVLTPTERRLLMGEEALPRNVAGPVREQAVKKLKEHLWEQYGYEFDD